MENCTQYSMAFSTYKCNFKAAMGTTNIPVNQWSHVAAVWNGSTFTLYVNGVLDPSSTSNRSAGVSENLRLGVSATYGSNHMQVC